MSAPTYAQLLARVYQIAMADVLLTAMLCAPAERREELRLDMERINRPRWLAARVAEYAGCAVTADHVRRMMEIAVDAGALAERAIAATAPKSEAPRPGDVATLDLREKAAAIFAAAARGETA